MIAQSIKVLNLLKTQLTDDEGNAQKKSDLANIIVISAKSDYLLSLFILKKKLNQIEFSVVFSLSLLSDSNQRPRDYKSRALAN